MTGAITGARLFDGHALREGMALVLEGGQVAAILPEADLPSGLVPVRRHGIVAPGFVDLQANGGGGLMVGEATDLGALRAICATHRRMGTAGILPTLITDRPEVTARVVQSGIAAARAGVPGFLGLHLEGPHLDPRRQGAHDPALIRPMGEADLALMVAASRALPALMVTLAPEAVVPGQIAALAAAGAVVSLGHSDCSAETAARAFGEGARCATHLFNAMSQIGNREPGLAGAVLAGSAHAGLIADGIHVHPTTLRLACAAREEGLFLVTDCMGFAGTDLTEMTLNGRRVQRRDGRLTLADGTLAGADLTFPRALQVLTRDLGLPVARALAMATRIPADLIGARSAGRLAIGGAADLVHLRDDLSLAAVCQRGVWTDL